MLLLFAKQEENGVFDNVFSYPIRSAEHMYCRKSLDVQRHGFRKRQRRPYLGARFVRYL